MVTVNKRMADRIDAQVFYLDAFIGLMIFLAAVVVFFLISQNSSSSDSRVLDTLVTDVESISATLMSEGTPANLTPNNISIIGLTDGSYRVNYTKVSTFYGLSYNVTNNMFGTNTNYLIFLKDKDGNVLAFDRCAFSNADVAVQNITPYICENITMPVVTNVVGLERLAFYNSGIIKLVVYVWV